MAVFFVLINFLVISINAQSIFPCQANYDELGIPHQEVKTIEEFYFCFGFHHGKDRAWEMDYFRKVVNGNNAEIFGYEHLKSDLMMKLLNLPALAQKIWNDMDEKDKKWLRLYADGANEGFKEGKNAKEFKDLEYGPSKWSPTDTISLILLQSFDQTRKTFMQDYNEEVSKKEWGLAASYLFREDGSPWADTILKTGEYKTKQKTVKSTPHFQEQFRFWSEFPTFFGEESGSNNWAISPQKSKDGIAIFANDPHLDLKTPLFWYWIHFKGPNFEVIGASLPGVPVVASGTNGKVAWGLTNAYINTADLVFLKDLASDQVEKIRPVVWVKFWKFKLPFFFKSFERLKTGHPIIPLEIESSARIALKWTGFSLNHNDIHPLYNLMFVEDVNQLDDLLKKLRVPAWNFTFADKKGGIGFRQVGKTYRHTSEPPIGIQTLDLENFLKEDILSADENPHLLNPERNYIYTANNQHWPLDAELNGGRGYSQSFRGNRIDELLQGSQDLESFKKIQCDVVSVDAKFFVPKILQHIKSPILQNWDFKAIDQSISVGVYRRLIDILREKWKVNEPALYRILSKLDEKQKNELQEGYFQAMNDIGNRQWHEVVKLSFDHLSKHQDWKFAPEISGVGDMHSINPGTSKWNPEKKIYEQYSGASMRMIIEMRDRPVIHLILPGLNRDYSMKSNLGPWQDWKNCKYSVVNF